MANTYNKAYATGSWLSLIGVPEEDIINLLSYFQVNNETLDRAYRQTQEIVMATLLYQN